MTLIKRHSSFHSAFKEERKHYTDHTDCHDTNEGPSVAGIPAINLNNFPAEDLTNRTWNIKHGCFTSSIFKTRAYKQMLTKQYSKKQEIIPSILHSKDFTHTAWLWKRLVLYFKHARNSLYFYWCLPICSKLNAHKSSQHWVYKVNAQKIPLHL